MHELSGRAPARIDFGGGWTDVPPYSDERGGCVCCAAIDLHAIATVRAARTARRHGDARDLAAAALKRAGAPALDLTIESEYPVGAGLGGSSAASVASLGILAAWNGATPDPAALAEQSRQLEVDDLGIAGGRQDHYAAAFGGILGLWFGGATRVQPIVMPPGVDEQLAARCVLVYTGESRVSGETITAVTGAYQAHNRRVLAGLDRLRELAAAMIESLERGNIDDLGALVGEHWIHQRLLHPGIPTPRIDRMLELAGEAGAIGGKAMGASGGGCVLAIAPEGRAESVRRAMAALGESLPVRFAERGFHVVPAHGAPSAPRRPWSPNP